MLQSPTLPVLQIPSHLVPKVPENYPFHDIDQDRIAQVKEVRTNLEPAFTQVGITLEDTERKWLDDRCLVRFFRASKFNVQQAVERLVNTIIWRRDYQPDRIDPEEVKPEAITGKEFISGFDKMGRPIMYLIPKRENTKTYERQIRYVVYNFEKAIKLMPLGVENICLVLDYENISMFNAPPMSVTKMFLQVFSEHYPEVYCIDEAIGYVFYRKSVVPLLDPVTASKLNFVDLKNENRKKVGSDMEGFGSYLSILEYIDSEQLLSEYGGSREMPWDFDSYWKVFTQV